MPRAGAGRRNSRISMNMQHAMPASRVRIAAAAAGGRGRPKFEGSTLSARAPAMDLQAKVEELDRCGFTVLEGLIAPTTIDSIRREFDRMLDGVRLRDRSKLKQFVVPAGATPGDLFTVPGSPVPEDPDSTAEVPVYIPQGATEGEVLDVRTGMDVHRGDIQSGMGGLQETERYTMHLPWRAPFADPAIYAHPTLLAFLEKYWEADDFRITCMHSNTPYPGSRWQRWHRDGGGQGASTHLGRSPGLGPRSTPPAGPAALRRLLRFEFAQQESSFRSATRQRRMARSK